MNIIINRYAKPDAAHWPGRRWLAALDAVLWPAVWVAAVALAPIKTQLVGAVVVALSMFFAITRLRRAVFANERYWFTTWRWGKVFGALLLVGMFLKVGLHLSR